jgi:hypothetical protein
MGRFFSPEKRPCFFLLLQFQLHLRVPWVIQSADHSFGD